MMTIPRFSIRRRMQRSNSISGAIVVALLLALLAGTTSVVDAEKKCIDIEDLSELRELISENDLFVYLVHESETSSSTYDELCNRYTNTPNDRVGNLIMGKVTVKEKGYDAAGDLKENDNRDIAKLVLGKKKSTSSDIHEYFIFLKNTVLSPMPGEKGLFKYVNSADEKNEEEVTPDILTEFIESKVPNTGKLGTWVYSLYPMDTITQLFVVANSANNGGEENDASGYYWRTFLAYNAKCLAYTMKFRIFKTSTSGSTKPDIADLYVKAMFQTLKHGSNYASKQISRMEKMMEKDGAKLSLEKKEEISQKIHILQKFTNNENEDAVITMSTYGKFLLQIIMTISSVVLLPAMIVYVIFGSLFGNSDEEPVEKESEEEKEEGKDDDVDDKKKADKTEESD